MAEAVRDLYTMNGAAAYDVYAYEQTAAQPLELPQGLPEELPQSREVVRVRAKAAVAPFTIVGLIAVACLFVMVIFGYVQLFEASSRVNSLETQLSNLQDDQMLLRARYEERIDLDEIAARAGEIGLSRPMPEQIVYVNLSGSDRAEIFRVEKTGLFEEVYGAMEESVTSLIAYLQRASA